jgi:hypothetical protein
MMFALLMRMQLPQRGPEDAGANLLCFESSKFSHKLFRQRKSTWSESAWEMSMRAGEKSCLMFDESFSHWRDVSIGQGGAKVLSVGRGPDQAFSSLDLDRR